MPLSAKFFNFRIRGLPTQMNPVGQGEGSLDLKSGIKEEVVDPAAIRDHLLKGFPQSNICHSFKELSEE